jgi:hypothetical protein
MYEVKDLLSPTIDLNTITLVPVNHGTISFFPHYKKVYPIRFTEETSPFKGLNADQSILRHNIRPYMMEKPMQIKYRKFPTLKGMIINTTNGLSRNERNICHYTTIYYPKRKIEITLNIMHHDENNYFERIHLLNTALEGKLLDKIVYTAIYDGVEKGYYAPKTETEKQNWPPKEFKYDVTVITYTDGVGGMLGHSITSRVKVSL